MDWIRRYKTRSGAILGILAGLLMLGAGIEMPAAPERIPHDQFKGRFRTTADRSRVIDEVERLIWARCSHGQDYNGITCAGRPAVLAWKAARARCARLNRPGEIWRLPTLGELKSLADPTRTGGARIDPRWFPATDPYGYWTGSHFSDPTGLFWSVYDFGAGRAFGARDGKYLVRCVTEWFGQ